MPAIRRSTESSVASRRASSPAIRPFRSTMMRSDRLITSGSSLEMTRMAVPFPASSPINVWISAFAPVHYPFSDFTANPLA